MQPAESPCSVLSWQLPQKVNTDLHVALGQARAQQQAAQDQCNLAEINLHKEVASRQLAEAAMQRAQQELADASAERWV